jgi:hypothetical protein
VSVSSPCKWQNIGLDEIKEYLTHLDLKKLDEEDWTYFDIFLSTDECIKIVMLSISSSKNSCLDRIKIPFFLFFSNIIIFFLTSFTLFSSTSTPSSSLSNSNRE